MRSSGRFYRAGRTKHLRQQANWRGKRRHLLSCRSPAAVDVPQHPPVPQESFLLSYIVFALCFLFCSVFLDGSEISLHLGRGHREERKFELCRTNYLLSSYLRLVASPLYASAVVIETNVRLDVVEHDILLRSCFLRRFSSICRDGSHRLVAGFRPHDIFVECSEMSLVCFWVWQATDQQYIKTPPRVRVPCRPKKQKPAMLPSPLVPSRLKHCLLDVLFSLVAARCRIAATA